MEAGAEAKLILTLGFGQYTKAVSTVQSTPMAGLLLLMQLSQSSIAHGQSS
jgi:hypothetical protein